LKGEQVSFEKEGRNETDMGLACEEWSLGKLSIELGRISLKIIRSELLCNYKAEKKS